MQQHSSNISCIHIIHQLLHLCINAFAVVHRCTIVDGFAIGTDLIIDGID